MRITGLRSFMTRDVGYMARGQGRPRVIVAIDTDQGITGWGECYDHGPDRALPPLLEYLHLQIAGHDPRRVEFLIQKLLQHQRFPPGALGLAAISAIDHALWDISAKALGVPVWQLLGGTVRDRVKVYLGVYTAPEPEEVRDRCQAMEAEHGFTAFKLSPFRTDIHAVRWGETVRATAAWVERLRAICPAHYDLAFDAHGKIFEPWQAVQLGNALAPFDPLFYEEPIRPEHVPAWAELKRGLRCPLATGESLYSRFEFLSLLSARGADIVQPDICAVGGITEMRRIATLADAHYVTVAPHNPMGPLATAVNLHFSAATTNFKILEYRLPTDTRYVLDPYLPKGGYLELRHDRPGWGVELDEAYLASDDYVHWERKPDVRPDGSTAWV
jgi:galactonate dehydratase